MKNLLCFRILGLSFALVLTLLSVIPARAATPQPPKVTGIFSDLDYSDEGGDLVGMEVFIVYGGDSYYATFQESEGESGRPVVVPVAVKGSQIRFTLPDKRTFVGTLTAKGLKLRLLGGRGPGTFLRRGKSYWQ